MKKLLMILLALSFCNISCEKDDICAESTPTTPLVNLKFYNKDIDSKLKSVPFIKVKAVGGDFMILSPTETTFSTTFMKDATEVKLPLKNDAQETQYELYKYLNKDDTAPVITKLKFTYTTSTIFVSRACGYKNNYELTNSSNNIFID